MQQKAMDLIVKDIDTGKREAVIAFSTYKTLDSDKDRSNRGMFDKSWKENFGMVRYFLNHKKDQAPGKILRLWDDADHAYAQVKHGTHTLGEDVLKQLDEGIIVAASFGFEAIRYKPIKDKGMDFLEVKHHEVSALTHWGAHSDSKPVSVTKALTELPFRLKQLSQPEQDMLISILANDMNSLQLALTTAADLDTSSDLYTFVMWLISRRAEIIANLRSELKWGTKEALDQHVAKMQKFIRTTSASDECIQQVQKSLNILTNNSDTATTTDTSSMVKCKKCGTHSVAEPAEDGSIKCAECSHLIKSASQPDASRSKDELRMKAAALRIKMMLEAD